MSTNKSVTIVREGRSYDGTWSQDGKIMAVSSAYGSKSATLAKGANTTSVARALLAELVEAWRRDGM